MRWIVLLLLLTACQVESAETGTVERIVDGDTIYVEFSDGSMHSVRLIGVDAPEMPRGQDPECFALEAKLKLEERIPPGSALILSSGAEADEDRYGRKLRYVHHNGTDINQLLIIEGYALHLQWFPHDRFDVYAEAEEIAQTEYVGLWSACE